jgi:hypothetical protein
VATTVLSSLAPERRPRLPAGPLIRATYANLRSSPRLVLRLLAPWYFVVVAIAAIRLAIGHWLGFGSHYDAWLSQLASGAAFLGGFFIALHWNRVILVRKGVPQARIFSLRALRFLAMLAVAAALVLLFGAAAVGSLAILGDWRALSSIHLGLLLLIALMFAAARLVPVLALASVDYPGSELLQALRLTRGQSLTLFQGVFAVAIPALLLRGVMLLLAFMIGHPVATIAFDVLATGFTFLAVTLASTFGALAYVVLADHRP